MQEKIDRSHHDHTIEKRSLSEKKRGPLGSALRAT